MKLLKILLLSTFAFTVFVNCSGTKSAVDTSQKGGKSVRVSMGNFLKAAINQEYDKFFRKNGFEEESYIEGRDITILTKWNDVPAFDDEKELGFIEVRVRITIEARLANTTSFARQEQNYKTVFIGDVEVRTSPADDWMTIPNTKMRDEHIRKMASDLKDNIRFAR